MPYSSDAQRRFMHAQHPAIAARWDSEMRKKPTGARSPQTNKVYRTGTPVAHKNMKLDPTGYINREVNKGKATLSNKGSKSGLAKMSLQRAAKRRMAIQKRARKA